MRTTSEAPATTPTAKSIELFESRVKEGPNDFVSLSLLGQLYTRRARETGDLAEYVKAEAAFRGALKIKPDYMAAKSLLAQNLTSQHKFEEALRIAKEVLESDPRRIAVHGTLFDAYVELGRYEAAQAELAKLESYRDNPTILARFAHFAELSGNNAEALNLIKEALNQVLVEGALEEEVAWFQYKLGDLYVHTGRPDDAVPLFEAALETVSDYPAALTGLAGVWTERGQPAKAAQLLQRAMALRLSPGIYFDLGDLYISLDRGDEAAALYSNGVALASKDELHRFVYARELASFYAEHDRDLDKALDLIVEDLRHRQDVFGYDTLAWVLYKRGDYNGASEAMAKALSIGIKEPEFYYHAGMIHLAQGRESSAKFLLESAITFSDKSSVAASARHALAGRS